MEQRLVGGAHAPGRRCRKREVERPRTGREASAYVILKARVEALEKDWVEEVDHDDALRSRIVRLELAIGMPLAVNVNFMQRVAAMEMESYGR